MKRIGVVGSRAFADYTLLSKCLDQFFFKPFVIVTGGATGADSLAERYAREHNLETKIWRPDWKRHGKRAGYIRNAEIVGDSNVVVAFWDGQSRGTKNTIETATDVGLPVYVVHYTDVSSGYPLFEYRKGGKRQWLLTIE